MDLHSLLPDVPGSCVRNGILTCVVAVASSAGYSLAVVRGLLIAVVSLVAEHGLEGTRVSSSTQAQ